MIISRTPFRISFFGGGTDYPHWYRIHGGSVLSTTINKYCYLSCRYLPPFFEHRIRVVYSKIESCQSVEEIEHPSVREVLQYLEIERGVEIHHDGDLPARSGMGSSSAFTVGLLHAMYALKGQIASKRQLALESISLEQEYLKEVVGSQDQVQAAYGGFNHITFMPSGDISVRPMTLPPERIVDLNDHLMLFYTGIKRTSSDIAKTYIHDVPGKKQQLRLLGDMVNEALSILSSGQEITAFGELLHEAWQVKRNLGERVSNNHIEEIYLAARDAGAIGGKLMGAGGGGFMVLFVQPHLQSRVREALKNLLYVPFKFDFTGSQIIFVDHEEDYSALAHARAQMSPLAFREIDEANTI